MIQVSNLANFQQSIGTKYAARILKTSQCSILLAATSKVDEKVIYSCTYSTETFRLVSKALVRLIMSTTSLLTQNLRSISLNGAVCAAAHAQIIAVRRLFLNSRCAQVLHREVCLQVNKLVCEFQGQRYNLYGGSTPLFCTTPLVSPKFPHVPLGIGRYPLSYEERRCWAN